MRNRGEVVTTIHDRSSLFESLLWKGKGTSFQLALEAEIPAEIRARVPEEKAAITAARYELEIGFDPKNNEIGINRETLLVGVAREKLEVASAQKGIFPNPEMESPSILQKSRSGWVPVIDKKPGETDNYSPEGKGIYQPSYKLKLGRTKSALANLPADEEGFPVGTWFKKLLEEGVQTFMLNSKIIRQPSPPGLGRRFQMDGSNLPWVIAELRRDPESFNAWLAHIQTALEDIRDIDVVERPEDRHRYLVVEYDNGARVPSWLVSDGTLRLLALTIPAYLKGFQGTFLVEEPENGIHPRAIETVLQSLLSIWDGQVLMATHSPIALNILEPRDILCFAKNREGATDIVSGDAHPALRDWKSGAPDLGLLFAAGVLS